MAEPAGTPGAPAAPAANASKRGAPKGQKQRVLTLIIEAEGVVKLTKIRTAACSVDDAWKELKMPENAKLCGVIKGHHEFMTQKVLRKPTYDELMKKAGLKD